MSTKVRVQSKAAREAAATAREIAERVARQAMDLRFAALAAAVLTVACGGTTVQFDTTEGVDCSDEYLAAEDRLAHTFPRTLNLSTLGDAEFYLSGEYMDDTFLAAAAEWNDQFSFDVLRAMTVGVGGNIRVYADVNLSAGGQTTGTVNNATIKMHPGVANPYENAIHEIGHSLGLAHENDPTSVMFGGTGGYASLKGTHISALSRCLIKTALLNGGAP